MKTCYVVRSAALVREDFGELSRAALVVVRPRGSRRVKREAQEAMSVSASSHASYEIRPSAGSGRPELAERRFTRNALSGVFAPAFMNNPD